MPLEIEAGQDAPVVNDQATPPEAAQVNAATTEGATGAPEGGEASQAAPAKTFTQSELDEIVRREKSKAEAKAERRVLRTLEKLQPAQRESAPPVHQQADDKPKREQFANEGDYIDKLTDWKLDQRDRAAGQEREQKQAQTLAQKTETVYAQAEKVPGFDREAFDALPLTRPIVEALIESDSAAQLMAYMASHPEDIARIAQLPTAARQAAELGKLEAKAAEKRPVQTSKAPDPIKPIGSGKTPVHDLAGASMEQYLEMRKKQGARWAR